MGILKAGPIHFPIGVSAASEALARLAKRVTPPTWPNPRRYMPELGEQIPNIVDALHVLSNDGSGSSIAGALNDGSLVVAKTGDSLESITQRLRGALISDRLKRQHPDWIQAAFITVTDPQDISDFSAFHVRHGGAVENIRVALRRQWAPADTVPLWQAQYEKYKND